MSKIPLSKTLCFTGHRPSKLSGYKPEDNKALLWAIQSACIDYIVNHGVIHFISGMALGIDQWAALIIIKLRKKYPHIKLTAAVPCKGHPNKWKAADREVWGHICASADHVVLVTNDLYTPQCMQIRNMYMVDNSKYVLAVWDETPGGTANCVKYAKNKEVQIINPKLYA